MEQKLVRVPFDIELAKKITNNEVDGKIVTRDGRCVRIVCWDMKSEDSIVALMQGEFTENVRSYTADGLFISKYENPGDLMLEIPEYMTFKDGVLIAYECGDLVLFRNHIFNRRCYQQYAVLSNGKLEIGTSVCMGYSESRLANEEERQIFINALKSTKHPSAKEYLKRFFGIEAKPEYNFKPFDKVLVRQKDFHLWVARFFDRVSDEGKFVCTDSLNYEYCIPYNEETKHLHNTTAKWEE